MKLDFENLSDAIFHYAKQKPTATAIVDGPETLNYSELAKLIGATCVYLDNLGIHADDHVGIILNNHADHIILALALMRIGATPIEISTEMPLATQDELINQLNMRAIFLEPGCKSGKNVPIRHSINLRWRDQLKIDGKNIDLRSAKKASENKIVMLTSGTTGLPKSIVSTHLQRIMRAQAHAHLLRDTWSADKPGNALVTLAISYAGPHQFFINQLLYGGAIYLFPKHTRTSDLIRTLGAYENVVAFVTASMARVLLACRDDHIPYLPNVQALISGGSSITAADKIAIHQYITPHFYESYGASGFGLICGLMPNEITTKAGSIGKPSPECVEIVNAQGEKLPAGVAGHVRCRGAAKADGYLTPNQSKSELFREQWYYPGDIALIDEDGYLYLKGRQADIINSNGIEIHPAEIEEVLMTHPSVKEAAVVGLRANSQTPDKPVAVIVPNEKVNLQQLHAYCSEHLSAEKRPVRFVIAPHIEKMSSGKINRDAVIEFAIDRIRAEAKNNAAKVKSTTH